MPLRILAHPPTEGLYTYEGSDEPTEGVSDGRPLANWFHDNDVTNTKKGVKLKNSDNIKLTSESARAPVAFFLLLLLFFFCRFAVAELWSIYVAVGRLHAINRCHQYVRLSFCALTEPEALTETSGTNQGTR